MHALRQFCVLIRIEKLTDGGAATLQCFHTGELRRQLMLAGCHLCTIGEGGEIQPFDQAVIGAETFQERLEKMNMGVDETWKQDHSVGIDHLIGSTGFRQIRGFNHRDAVSPDGD